MRDRAERGLVAVEFALVAPRRARDQRGVAAVEFALVLPLLVTLLFGLITTGLAYADHISVTNAVREGARYGAAADAGATYSSSPACNATTWSGSVRCRVQQVYADSESQLTDAEICVRLIDNSNAVLQSTMGASCGAAPTSWPPTMAAGTCAVEVWASKPRTISMMVFPDLNFDIGGSSIAYYGRTVTGCPALP